jgi:hypothetical protein
MGSMNSYMIDIELPEVLGKEFIELIPHQRATVSRMMKQGTISHYSLSYDRTRLWVVMNAESIKDVKLKLASFPIYSSIKFKIFSLLFHESNTNAVPQLWLN